MGFQHPFTNRDLQCVGLLSTISGVLIVCSIYTGIWHWSQINAGLIGAVHYCSRASLNTRPLVSSDVVISLELLCADSVAISISVCGYTCSVDSGLLPVCITVVQLDPLFLGFYL